MSNARNLANLLGTKTKVKDVDVDGTELILDSDGDSSITSDTDDQIDFKVGGTDVVTITSDGELLLGTTTAPSGGSLHMVINSSSGGGIQLTRNNSGGSVIDAIEGGGARFFTFTGAVGSESYTERMRLSSDGDLFLGTGGAIPSASQSGFAIQDNAGKCLTQQATNDTGVNAMCQFINPNGVVGIISTSGSNTVYSTSSDYRLKENVTTSWDATSRLKHLKPSRFNFKADKDTTVDGFLAHEVSSIVPEAIIGEKDAVDKDGNIEAQGIDQSKLVPLLTKALQEAVAKIETLEAKVTALESK